MRSVAGGIDGLGAVFDDGSFVADAGLLLAGTVMSRLGLEALIDEVVRPGGSAGSGAGRKVLSLVASMLVGGCCIDDVQRLRSGSSQRGNVHFARETLARVRRLAPHAAVTVRADAGFDLDTVDADAFHRGHATVTAATPPSPPTQTTAATPQSSSPSE